MTDNNSQATETLRQQACKQVSANLHQIARLVNKNFKTEERVPTDEFIEEIKVFISKELDIPVDKVFIECTIGGEPDVLNFGPYADEVLDLLIDREIKILEKKMMSLSGFKRHIRLKSTNNIFSYYYLHFPFYH